MPDWRLVDGLHDIDEQDWQTLDTHGNPFLSYPFLHGLERFNCLRDQHWQPTHIVIESDNTLQAVMPLYIKHDSNGEFVFDWAWADAWHRAGRAYYPKLVSAIPFTPVSGPRLLTVQTDDQQQLKSTLLDALKTIMQDRQLSSSHILFPNDTDTRTGQQEEGFTRYTIQYHWLNDGYRDFRDFTDRLRSKKRKKLLHEREQVKAAGIEIKRLTGEQITVEHWQVFHEFYCSTFYKKWGEPRFNLDFFQWLGKTMPEQVLLLLAKQDETYVAGAFAMQDKETLYGRHWGCKRDIPFLHFELCYYQTIEHVINNGLKRLDAGVQGEHKLARGFQPIAMPSLHWIRDPLFANAINDYLQRETLLIDEHVAMLRSHLPFKQER